MRPSRAWSFRPLRGRGERRMPVAPAASCALCIGKKHTSIRVPRNHPAFPHAMVLTVSFALSPVIGLSCHRRRWSYLRRLDASVEASGPHDFAVRKPCAFVKAPPASTASHPASVTIAIRPSVGQDDANLALIWGGRERKY